MFLVYISPVDWDDHFLVSWCGVKQHSHLSQALTQPINTTVQHQPHLLCKMTVSNLHLVCMQFLNCWKKLGKAYVAEKLSSVNGLNPANLAVVANKTRHSQTPSLLR